MYTLPDRVYPSKILLFGEHLVLEGAMSLAIPHDRYGAHWTDESGGEDMSAFLKFLSGMEFIDQERLDYLGRYKGQLKSDIPRGFGLGSSGSLCAAAYEFLRPDYSTITYSQIITELAHVEGFFHGKSSGLDAFVILMNQPVICQSGSPQLVNLDFNHIPFDIELIDSGISRSSKGLIEQFLKSDEEIGNKKELKLLNDRIIQSIINQQNSTLFTDLNLLSRLQYESMKYMIVDSVRAEWEDSLHNNRIAIKLCGAGGGGYYLKFTLS